MSNELRDFQKNLPMALLRARESVMSHFRPILRDHDITEQQWRVIRALHGSGGVEYKKIESQIGSKRLAELYELLESIAD